MGAGIPKAVGIKIHLEDGSMWATVDELPGVFATGDSLEELRESLEEAISLYLSDDANTVEISLAPLTVADAETAASAELQLA